MGFETPRLPTQPRERSKYLGEHVHSGKKGDRNRTTTKKGRKAQKAMVSWVKR